MSADKFFSLENYEFRFFRETMDAVTEGQITAEAYIAAFNRFVGMKSDVLAALNMHTIAELEKRQRKDKKANMVSGVWTNLIFSFAYVTSTTGGVSYSFDEIRTGVEIMVGKKLEKLTDEMIQAYADSKRAAKDERLKESAAIVAAMMNPSSYWDYQQLVGRKGETVLTPAQMEEWDNFRALEELERLEKEEEKAAKVAQVKLAEGIQFVITKDFHEKRQVDIWVIKLSEKIDRPEWKELDDKAHRFGARWNSWGAAEKHGWIFFDEGDAAAFMGLTEGEGTVIDRWKRREEERQQRTALRLEDSAARLEEDAEDRLNQERKTNTVKRAREAAYAEENAREDLEFVQVLESIGEAIGRGESVFLKRIRHKTHVEMFESMLRQARDARLRAENKGYMPDNIRNRPVYLADVAFVSYPWPVSDRGSVAGLVRATEGKRGMKPMRNLIASLANKQNKEQVTFDNWEAVSSLYQLMECDGATFNVWHKEEIARLQKMKIMTPHLLRATLREYLTYRTVSPVKADEARILELNLVGRKIPGYFPTPRWVAEKMADMLDIQDCGPLRILEPNGGSGRLCDAVSAIMDEESKLETCEINYDLRILLGVKGYDVVHDDFMTFDPTIMNQGENVEPVLYDRIIANFPFENRQDQIMALRAYDMLADGGCMVAITGTHWQFAKDAPSLEFYNWIQDIGAEVEELPEGTFRESGTNVNSVIITISK